MSSLLTSFLCCVVYQGIQDCWKTAVFRVLVMVDIDNDLFFLLTVGDVALDDYDAVCEDAVYGYSTP
jgi:hypothetical protein